MKGEEFMQQQSFYHKKRGVILALILVLILTSVGFPQQDAAAQMVISHDNGIVCTSNAENNFNLTTKTGYIGTPDDNVIFMWGFSEGSKPFQHPGPILCVEQGATVTVTLKNELNTDVSIVFPGQEDVLANGAPSQPQMDTNGNLVSMAPVAAANGGSMTYRFVANRAGTFVYQSGTNPAVQVRMGLFGAIIVRPPAGPNGEHYVFGSNARNQYNPETEFMVLFSEIDPFLNQAVELGRPFNMDNYLPRYWMINGRGFPDTIAPNFASWLPSQPYGAMARIHPYDPVNNPLPALERFINVGTEIVPMHPHAKNALVVNRDGRAVEGPGGQDLSWENFSLPVAPGQTYDGLFKWEDAEQYNPDTNPVPVTIPSIQNMVYGMLYSGSPYLGQQGPFPVGTTGMNECGEYYIISHNHALYQITSWGIPMTGPITYLRIDPPMPNTCP